MYECTEVESKLIQEAVKRAEERSSRPTELLQRLSSLDTIFALPEPDTEEIRENRKKFAKYAESVSQIAEEISRPTKSEEQTPEEPTEFGIPGIPGAQWFYGLWSFDVFPRPRYRLTQYVPRRTPIFQTSPDTGRYQLERSTSRTTPAEGLVRGIGDADFGKIFITTQAANGQRATFSAEIGIVLRPESGRSRVEFWPNLSYAASGFIHVNSSNPPYDIRAENTMTIWLIADSTDLQGQNQTQVASTPIPLWTNRGQTGGGGNTISQSGTLAQPLICNVAASRIYYFWVIVETTTTTQADLAKGNTSSCYVDLTLSVPSIGVFQF